MELTDEQIKEAIDLPVEGEIHPLFKDVLQAEHEATLKAVGEYITKNHSIIEAQNDSCMAKGDVWIPVEDSTHTIESLLRGEMPE